MHRRRVVIPARLRVETPHFGVQARLRAETPHFGVQARLRVETPHFGVQADGNPSRETGRGLVSIHRIETDIRE